MREDTVFSPQSPLNAPMLRFLFLCLSRISFIFSDPFSSYVNLLVVRYWMPLLEERAGKSNNEIQKRFPRTRHPSIRLIDLDPRYCFIRLWSVDAAIAVAFSVSNVSCIEIVPQNWPGLIDRIEFWFCLSIRRYWN